MLLDHTTTQNLLCIALQATAIDITAGASTETTTTAVFKLAISVAFLFNCYFYKQVEPFPFAQEFLRS